MMRGAQVCGHSQLTIDERGHGLGRQVLSGAELARSDRRIAL
jgi:hypothetical protein